MYWQRSILKENAKVSLRNKYWLSFAVSLVASLLAGAIISVITYAYSYSLYHSMFLNFTQLMQYSDYLPYYGYDSSAYDLVWTYMGQMILRMAAQLSGLSLLAILLRIFVGAAMRVGSSRYYVHKRFDDTNFSTLFSGFQNNWLNTVGALFVTDLFCSLWALLFIIPGIVKRYQYYYVEFLLSDNPNLTGTRAREISRMLTNGEKGRIFIFDLSFFWWYLLVGITSWLTLGLSHTFLLPYVQSARAELYIFARDRAINAGQLNPAELGLAQPQTPPVC